MCTELDPDPWQSTALTSRAGRAHMQALIVEDPDVHRAAFLWVCKLVHVSQLRFFSEIAKHLSLPPVKLHCSMLAEDAIKAAVKDYEAKQAKMEPKGEDSPAEKAAEV
jgi:hypothetical protein